MTTDHDLGREADAAPARRGKGSGVDFRRVSLTDPDAARLVEEVQAEYVARYGGRDETPLDPHVFDDPHGALFLGYLEEVPVVSGGWRLRSDVATHGSDRTAEVKRMYVTPTARGLGLARRMLVHLEATALAAGAEVMVLETGLRQPEAIALYESAGYERIPGFGHYAWSPSNRCYGRRLLSG